MAHELQIRNSHDRVKIRNPWAVALLPIITLGIYHIVWWYRINRELRDYGRANGHDLGQNPTSSLLAIFPGSIIVVPALVTYWRGTKRVQGAARIAGAEPPNGWIALILYLLIGVGFYAYLQVALNDVWRSAAEPLPGQAPLPPLHDTTMPPPLDSASPAPATADTASGAASPPAPAAPTTSGTPQEPGANVDQDAAASPDALDQLQKLDELREAGVITPEEFDAKKADLLRRI